MRWHHLCLLQVFSEFSEMHEICPLSCPLCPLGTKFRICIFLETTVRSETLKTKLWKQYFTSCIFNMERKLQSWNSKTEPTLCKSVKVESNVKEQLRVRESIVASARGRPPGSRLAFESGISYMSFQICILVPYLYLYLIFLQIQSLVILHLYLYSVFIFIIRICICLVFAAV